MTKVTKKELKDLVQKKVGKKKKAGSKKSIFPQKVLKSPKAQIKGIDAMRAITPTEHISVVRSAEQVQPRTFEEPRSLFFKSEFEKEKKSSRSFIWFLTLTFHVPQLFVLGGEL